MIGDEINCLKNVGFVQLSEATSYCQSLNASQILPRNKKESDDLVSALLSLDLSSKDGETLVSIGIYKKNVVQWFDSEGQLLIFANWLPNKPDNPKKNWLLTGSHSHESLNTIQKNYAGFRLDGAANETGRWADYVGTDELNVVCTKTASHGKNISLLNNNKLLSTDLKILFSGSKKRNVKNTTKSLFFWVVSYSASYKYIS